MSEDNIKPNDAENIMTVYRELCASYRAIDDFRTKLLGLLPLATGGIFLFIPNSDKFPAIVPLLLPMGCFGFAITLGLFCFELYGIRKCTCLIDTGRELEEQMGEVKGQFATRPPGILGFINEPLAAGIIYPAVLAVWFFLASYNPGRENSYGVALGVFIVGFLISCLYLYGLKRPQQAS